MDTLFQQLYLPGATDSTQELNPSFAQTVGAAFNLENDVVNLLDYMSQPTFKPDPEFNLLKEFRARNLPTEWLPMLAETNSTEEFDAKLAKVQKEYRDKAVLAASGWTGTVAAIAAGMLSPTVFIPLTGQARGVKGFAEVLALAAAGAGAQNGALFLNQATRSEAELYTGVALDTLFLGLMGGAYLGLPGRARKELINSVKLNEKKVTAVEGPLDVPRPKETSVQVEPLTPADVKEELRQAGVRKQDDVAKVVSEVIEPDTYVPLRDRALAIGEVKRVRAKDMETKATYGGSWLEVPVADGVVARFTKATGGTKFFVGGEYGVTLHTADGAEISIPPSKVDNFARAGNTMISSEKELRAAIAEGKLDDLFYQMLETADEPPRMVDGKTPKAISNSDEMVDLGRGADAKAVGAAPTKKRNTLGAKAAPSKTRQALMDQLGRFSPSYRMLTQRVFASLRDAIAKLDTSGIQQAGLDVMEPSAVGGLVIERIKLYDFYVAELTKALDENFLKYYYDGAKDVNFNSAMLAQIKSQFFETRPGKMNWEEYKAAVFDGLNTGNFSPEIADSVAAFKKFFSEYAQRQKQYLEEFAARGLDVEPLFKELTGDKLGDGVTDYAHHIFDQNKLAENFSEFIDVFGGYYAKELAADFAKDTAKYNKRRTKLDFERQIADFTPEQLTAYYNDVESSRVFIDDMPEVVRYKDEVAAVKKEAKDFGWPKEQLKAELNRLENDLGPDVKELLFERKRLAEQARLLRKYGGDTPERATKLREVVAKADELISDTFRQAVSRIASIDLSAAKMKDAGEKALTAAAKDLEKVVKVMQARQAQLAKLLTSKRQNPVTRAKVEEQFAAAEVKHKAMLERLAAVQGKQAAFDERLRELQLLRTDAISDANDLVRGRVLRAQEAEERLKAVEEKPLTEEEKLRKRDQISEELWALEQDFRNKWEVDPGGSKLPDFRGKAIEAATMLHQKLTGGEIALSPAYHVLRQGKRGAELLRVMNIPYELKQRWLIKDVELVSRAYDRAMAPDLELWRAFDGSVNGRSVLEEMQQEVVAHIARINTAKYVKLPAGWVDKAAKFSERVQKRLNDFGEAEDVFLGAENFSDVPKEGFVPLTDSLRSQLGQMVTDAAKAYTHDFDVAIQRLRHTRGVPNEATLGWWRAGKVVKDLNVLTMMGSVVPASVSDVARPIWAHGVNKVWGRGWAPFVKSLISGDKTFRIKSKRVNNQVVLNLEPMLFSRAQGMFDLAQEAIGRTKLERGVHFAAQKMGIIALFSYWTAAMKSIAGNVTHATLAEYVPQVAKAWREGVEPTGDLLQMRTYLRNLGLSDLDIHRIATQMEQPGGVEYFSNGGVLPNIDQWTDPAAYQAYQAAINAEVNKLIVTPGLERPNIADENMAYSLLFQFKSFTFASNSRMVMSGLQGNDPYLMQGIAFSLAFGALSYYTYAVSVGGKTLEEANEFSPEQWTWEAVKRSGILGLMSIPVDFGEKLPATNGEDTSLFFRKQASLLGAILGPTYTQVDKLGEFLMKMDAEDPKQQARNMRTLRQLFVPYQNHFLLRRLFDRVGEAMFGST
jgi:hypothetical protein